jgi:hypothetical protein
VFQFEKEESKMSETPGKLPRDWYKLVVCEGVDRDLPGFMRGR